MLKQMRNTRTGKIAVYDADLVESGRWEVLPTEEAPQEKLPVAEAMQQLQQSVAQQTMRKKQKPGHHDKVAVADEQVSIQLIKG